MVGKFLAMGNVERNNTMRKEREERDFKVREKLAVIIAAIGYNILKQ